MWQGIEGTRGISGPQGLQVLHVYDWTFAVTAADHLVAAVNFLAPWQTQNGVHVANRNSVKLLTCLPNHF